MEREERVDLVNPQEPKSLDERDKTLATPSFDENSIHSARPAVPLAHDVQRARASRSLPLVALAVAAGLLGGIVGIFALNFYERRGTQPQPAQVNTTTNANRADESRAPTPQAQPAATINAASAQTNNARMNTTASLPEADALKNDRAADASAATNARGDSNTTTPGDAHSAQTDQTQRASDENETQELRAALGEWITATNARDIDRQMKLYEPRVAAYYLSRNASREAVRAEKENVFARASAVDVRAGEPEITLSPDGQTAAMRFRKEYTIAGNGFDKRGAVIQELRWRRTAKGWHITSERDLRVVN
ncbi:MAG: SnoaL-like domain [Acidobacteriota bacterium]|nr:SnoaL-like domain [Acidobacteriota bacterium]